MGHKPGHHKHKDKGKHPSPMPSPVSVRNEQAAPKTDTSGTHTIQDVPKEVTLEPSVWEKWTCRATIVMAATMIFYTVFAGWQMWIMRGQLSRMEADSRLEYRPWIGVSGGLVSPIEVAKKIEIRFALVNTGKTPAINVQVQCNAVILPTVADIGDWMWLHGTSTVGFSSHPTFPPNGTIMQTVTCDGPHSKQTLDNISNKKAFVYSWGSIAYGDTLGGQHTTSFCYIVDPERKNELTAYSQGNSMD